MFLNIILVIIGLVIFGIPFGIGLAKSNTKPKTLLISGGVALLIFISAFSFTIIPTGHTGVRTIFGQVNSSVVNAGFNWQIPFIEGIEAVNNKQQDEKLFTDDATKIAAESSEKTPVYLRNVVVTYQISPEKSSWIYANISNYKENAIQDDLVASAVKNATVTLTTYEVTNREKIEPLAKSALQNDLDEKFGKNTITIRKVVISNMDFDKSYNDAIVLKSQAEMKQKQQTIENQTIIDKAKAEANAKITEAQGTKTANTLLEKSITNKVLVNKWLDRWNGQVSLVDGNNGNTMIDISKIMDAVKTEDKK